MFATYDFSNFPIVKIILKGSILDDNDFSNFTNQWINLYDNKKHFEFLIYIENLEYIELKYCLYTAIFLKSMKKKPIQYLKKSKIYTSSKYIYYLLNIIFNIEKPVAPLELIFIDKNKNEISKHFTN
jgi:hypothetical protein